MSLLPYISDNELKQCVLKVVEKTQSAIDEAESKMNSNAIDPFSALFDSTCMNVSMEDWFKKEQSRQIQKTLQNAVGDFHEDIIGSIHGWKKLQVGNVVDVVNSKKKIIAEIKNKHNTTKGSDKKQLYDNLASQLSLKTYNGYTGYYVEVIPKNKKEYNKPFTPSDNITKSRREGRDDIRVIDGKSFYTLASGYDDALFRLYKVLPAILSDVLDNESLISRRDSPLFKEIFRSSYNI